MLENILKCTGRIRREWGSTQGPIVPRHTIIGRALVFVVGVMCFLAVLSLSAAVLVEQVAEGWLRQATQEVTVQIVPDTSTDSAEDEKKVRELLTATPGVVSVRVYSQEENRALLEPWLGKNFVLDRFPLPILIGVSLDLDVPLDLEALAEKLREAVPNVLVDGHQTWQVQVQKASRWLKYTALLIFFLIFGSTIAIIISATRAAVESNREIIEVLRLVGAEPGFIVGEFRNHFLLLGVQGGLLGGGIAFLLVQSAHSYLTLLDLGFAQGFGKLSGFWYLAILGMILASSVLSALVSQWTLQRNLEALR